MKWLVVAALAACRPGPTEVVVTVDTTFGVPCTIDTLVIEAGGHTETVPVTDADLPGSLTLATDSTDAVDVTVTGLRAGEAFAVGRDHVAFADHESLELRFLLDRTCVPGPCPALGIGGFDGLPARAERRGCGDASYAQVASGFAMRDACDIAGATHLLVSTDEVEAPAEMPFPFTFYGAPVTMLWISDNGYVGFSDTPPDSLADKGASRSLGNPDGSFPVRGVLPFWDDLRTGKQGVCTAVTGVVPDRILWITWREACFKAGTTPCGMAAQGTLTFTAALEETTDRVYIGYQEMVGSGGTLDRARGQTATIGITNAGSAACTADACSAEGTCASGEPCGYTEVSSGTITTLHTVEMRPR